MKTGLRSSQEGFTIVELVLAMAVLVVVTAVAVPSFQNMQADGAMRSSSSDFVIAVNTARMQAVSLRNTVTLKPLEGNDWSSGWQVEYPAEMISEKAQHFTPYGTVALSGPNGVTEIQFRANGLTTTGEVVFTLCDDRIGEQGRKMTISPFGRVTNETQACS